MRALRASFLVTFCVLAGVSSADMTGILPGDIVVSNIGVRAGHAGIYIGRWSSLPEATRRRYAKAYAEAEINSGCKELLDSYLVVDSMPSRGVRVASFAEEFSNMFGTKWQKFPNLNIDLNGAMKWSNDKGCAVVPAQISNADRLRLVEYALGLAEARVPYELVHTQLDNTRLGQWMTRAGITNLKLDCISMCAYVYDKALGIDIDVSYKPWMTPTQLYESALENSTWRKNLDFNSARADVAFLGRWKVEKTTFTGTGITRSQLDDMQSEVAPAPGSTFTVRRTGTEHVYTVIEDRHPDTSPQELTWWAGNSPKTPYGVASAKVSETGGGYTIGFAPSGPETAWLIMDLQYQGKKMRESIHLRRERRAVG